MESVGAGFTAAVIRADPPGLFFETLSTAKIEKVVGSAYILDFKNDELCAYTSADVKMFVYPNEIASEVFYLLGLAVGNVEGNAVLMRRDNKPFSRALAQKIEKCFATAKTPYCCHCEEKAGEVFFRCAKAGCPLTICETCSAEYHHFCDDHE
jgi:hypothetical protein